MAERSLKCLKRMARKIPFLSAHLLLILLLNAVNVGKCLFGDEGETPEGSLGFISSWEKGSSMCHNNCNGHGRCISTGNGPTCECAIGWGNTDDITEYRSPGCDKRVHPYLKHVWKKNRSMWKRIGLGGGKALHFHSFGCLETYTGACSTNVLSRTHVVGKCRCLILR